MSSNTVSALGKAGQPIEEIITPPITFGTQAVTLSGDVTIYPNGSLTWKDISGTITDSALGAAMVGTMNGTATQPPE
jgi:hypothetical protein